MGAPVPDVGQEAVGTVLVDVVDAEREAALEALKQQEQIAKEERHRADQATQQLGASREEVALLRERCQTLQKAVEDEETRRGAIEIELEKLRHNPEWAVLRERVQTLEDASKKVTEEHEREISRLESQLRERGQQVAGLEAEVLRRDKLVRELVATAVPPQADGPANGHTGGNSDLSAQLDRMAGEAALREADLVAARWRIAQLERELTQAR
jgi:chromosome segregation ATPase